mmetsp:Transcript_34275/g.74972  ORF Transcript_34275/g.74972 Transcript_34275/m.74972 type:complete len:206 (+) Transcript_34275:1211-1828(+)
MEVPECGAGGRQHRGGVLQCGSDQQHAAGGHGHEDDPRGQEHPQPHRLQGHLRGQLRQLLPRPRAGATGGDGGAQLLAVRLDADRGRRGREHVPVHQRARPERARGARGVHLQDRRGAALLHAAARARDGGGGGHDHLRLLPRGVQRAPHGVCRGGEPAHEPQARGQRRINSRVLSTPLGQRRPPRGWVEPTTSLCNAGKALLPR